VTTYLLLADDRDLRSSAEPVRQVNLALIKSGRPLCDRFESISRPDNWGGAWVPEAAYGLTMRDCDPQEVVEIIKRAPFDHPVLLFNKARDEQSWSWVTVFPSSSEAVG
jgi:hypothetical protein